MAHDRGYGFLGWLAATGILAAYPLAGMSQAQEDGARVAELTFGPALRWDDEDGLEALLGLGGAYRSRTDNQTIDFSFSTGLEQSSGSVAQTPFSDRTLRFFYSRESRQSALDFGLRYRRADISVLEDDDFGDDVVEFGTGTREDYAADAAFVFGRAAPFGGRLDLGYDVREYSDTDDPSKNDRERSRAALVLRFDVDPRISTELRGRVSDTNYEGNGRDVARETLGLAFVFDVSRTLTTDLSLGQTRVTESGNGPKTTFDGYTLRFAFTEDRRNGAWTGSLVSDLNDSGERRTTARVARNLELPLGEFAAGFGLSQSEGDDLRPLYDLAYKREGRNSAFDVSFRQNFTSDDEGDEALNSRLSLSYRQALTQLSSFGASLSLRQTTYLTGNQEDDSRLDLRLVYRYQLAEDWGLVSSYVHRIDSENDNTERDDEIYLGIEKTFKRRF